MSEKQHLERPLTYGTAGVDTMGAEKSIRALGTWIEETFGFNPARPLLPLGYFANVVPLSAELGLVLCTDGVGTKLLIAEQMGKFDTVGIDCVAMNANDVLCVGGRPVSLVDYIAVACAEPAFLEEIAKGLRAGAQQAAINIPGGEIAQVRELLHDSSSGNAFDLVATCVGTVHPDRLLIGEQIRPGDLVVGLASSGMHSNGFTLARRVLFERGKLRVEDHIPDLGRTLGEELLEPTVIYVRAALSMLDADVGVRAFAHVTGDGLLNLARVAAPVGFVLDHLQDIPPIFRLVEKFGHLDAAEMFQVFNMGTGFCVVVDPRDAARVASLAAEHGHRAATIGYAVADPQRRVWIPEYRLASAGKRFVAASEPAPLCPT